MIEAQRKEILEVLVVGFELSKGIVKSMDDDEWDWTDAFNFTPVLKALPAAVDNFKEIPTSFMSMTREDKEWFISKMDKGFDISNDKLEQWIEGAFDWVLTTILMVISTKETFNKKI